GLDLGGTSPDALRTLMELGAETYVFGVAGDRTFHPKVAMLTRGASPSADYTMLVGSQNWTPGGLDSNFEVGVRLDLRQSRSRRRPSGNPPTPVRKRGLARRLLLEVTGPETGQGREIQVPKASLEEFFGIRPKDVLYMTFVHEDGTIERNRPLASYANQTYQ